MQRCHVGVLFRGCEDAQTLALVTEKVWDYSRTRSRCPVPVTFTSSIPSIFFRPIIIGSNGSLRAFLDDDDDERNLSLAPVQNCMDALHAYHLESEQG